MGGWLFFALLVFLAGLALQESARKAQAQLEERRRRQAERDAERKAELARIRAILNPPRPGLILPEGFRDPRQTPDARRP